MFVWREAARLPLQRCAHCARVCLRRGGSRLCDTRVWWPGCSNIATSVCASAGILGRADATSRLVTGTRWLFYPTVPALYEYGSMCDITLAQSWLKEGQSVAADAGNNGEMCDQFESMNDHWSL